MSDYQKLLQEYNELKNDKTEAKELIKEIQRLKKINSELRKEIVELSYLITELMKKGGVNGRYSR